MADLEGGGFACGPSPSLFAENTETIERLRHRSSLPKAERDLLVLRDYAAAGDPEAIRLLAEREATTNEMETTT